MPAYARPGVYYERVDATAPAISVLRTDVAGFVGIAVRGPIDMAVPIQSFRQFQAHFGEFTGAGFLAYCVRGFFENGGRRCWIVRVASKASPGGAADANTILQSPNFANPASPLDVWLVAASSPGVWGNDLTVTIKETHRAEATTEPNNSQPESSGVSSITGFKRATMVQLSQGVLPSVFKVVSGIDAVERRLIWVDNEPRRRLPYDSPLVGFDPNRPILVQSVEYTFVVRRTGNPIALFEGLSLIPEHDDYGPTVLAPLKFSTTFEPDQVLPFAPLPITITELRDFRQPATVALEPIQAAGVDERLLEGGADGLALLEPYDFMGEPISATDSDEVVFQKRRGLRALELIDEVAMVAVPDINIQPIRIRPKDAPPVCKPDACLPNQPLPIAVPRPRDDQELPPTFSDDDVFRVQSALIQQCEDLRDRIAILDPPFGAARNDQLGVGAIRAWRNRFESKYAALYYPWLRVVDALRTSATGITRDIPASGHVAGEYARTDLQVGVHKAPANDPLAWIQDVTVQVDDEVHAILNPVGINVVRSLPGRGLRIMGARTVSSDPDWRFVNVRRLMMMIEEAIDEATQWAVFEPNDFYTRAKVTLSISSFLIALWQIGALAGKTIEESLFVKCDETNNPPFEREQGRLIVDVGVAPSNPFEFIVLRVGRTNNEFEVTEYSLTAQGGN